MWILKVVIIIYVKYLLIIYSFKTCKSDRIYLWLDNIYSWLRLNIWLLFVRFSSCLIFCSKPPLMSLHFRFLSLVVLPDLLVIYWLTCWPVRYIGFAIHFFLKRHHWLDHLLFFLSVNITLTDMWLQKINLFSKTRQVSFYYYQH